MSCIVYQKADRWKPRANIICQCERSVSPALQCKVWRVCWRVSSGVQCSEASPAAVVEHLTRHCSRHTDSQDQHGRVSATEGHCFVWFCNSLIIPSFSLLFPLPTFPSPLSSIRLVKDTDITCFTFSDFGKHFCKIVKLSTDGFIQMAIQLAFYKWDQLPTVLNVPIYLSCVHYWM